VFELLEKLLNIKDIDPKSIGIITPYRKQADKIKKRLHHQSLQQNDNRLKQIDVGTVEIFQGQERKIIIVSTVRSREESRLDDDRRFKIGFVNNYKRMNVAISRAMDALFVIGNGKLLGK